MQIAVGRLLACVALLATVLPVAGRAADVYAFGDSLLDDGTILRTTGSHSDAATGALFSGYNFSNGVTAFDDFGRLTGLDVDEANDHAIAGVFSGLNSSAIGDYPGTLAQVDAFVAGGGRFGPRDIVLLDGGTNELETLTDPAYGLPNGLSAPVTVGQLVTYVGENFGSMLATLKIAGLRDVFVYNVPNGSAAALAINAALVTSAAAASGHGLNIHVFDLRSLYDKTSNDPALYGFASRTSCAASAACVADPATLENHYFTIDGVHPTTAGHDLIARYLASQYEAPQAVLPQAILAEATALVFSQTLVSRLDSATQSPGERGPGAPPALAGLLPQTLVPTALGPVTSFVSASGGGGHAAAPGTTSGPAFASFGYDLAGLTIGNEVQPTQALRLGSAFNYLDSGATAPAFAPNRIALHALQGSLYGGFTGPHVFVDEALTYGLDIFETSRAGVVTRLRGVAVGGTVSSETKAGYLLDWGFMRVGPIADLAYSHVLIGSYSETGDSLLTLRVGRQTVDALTLAAGLQWRSGPLPASWMSSVLDLTADHEVFGAGRALITAQTYAPGVLIRTTTDEPAASLYGRVRGTLHADLAAGFSADLSGFGTFEKASGDSYGLDARLQLRF